MKKALCYKAVARKTDEMVSDGFIIVEIENERIISCEGIFTFDYLTSKIGDSMIVFEYYTINENFDCYNKIVEIPIITKEFEIPSRITISLRNGKKFEIEMKDRVLDEQLENYYQNSLKKLKSRFSKEW